MPDADRSLPIDPAAALRALPPERPASDAWPGVAARLARARRLRHLQRWGLAAAALLALALWLPSTIEPDPAQDALALAQPDDELLRLKTASAHLESLLRELPDEHQDAGSQLLQLRLQEEIAGIDALLASSQTSPEIEAWLWSERVLRLQRLSGLNAGSPLLAADESAASNLPTVF